MASSPGFNCCIRWLAGREPRDRVLDGDSASQPYHIAGLVPAGNTAPARAFTPLARKLVGRGSRLCRFHWIACTLERDWKPHGSAEELVRGKRQEFIEALALGHLLDKARGGGGHPTAEALG